MRFNVTYSWEKSHCWDQSNQYSDMNSYYWSRPWSVSGEYPWSGSGINNYGLSQSPWDYTVGIIWPVGVNG